MPQYAIINSENVIENIAEADAALESNWYRVDECKIGDKYFPETDTVEVKAREASVNEEQAKSLLAESDWTQFEDVGLTLANVGEWRTYRAALREIAKNPTEGDLTWPEEPSKEYV